jgi:hypothetical protein
MAWAILLLAYLTCGILRVHTDFTADPVDRPAYAREGGFGMSVLAALRWWRGLSLWNAVAYLVVTFMTLHVAYRLLWILVHSRSARLAILALIPTGILIATIICRPEYSVAENNP